VIDALHHPTQAALAFDIGLFVANGLLQLLQGCQFTFAGHAFHHMLFDAGTLPCNQCIAGQPGQQLEGLAVPRVVVIE
jgi:hypothetical protein